MRAGFEGGLDQGDETVAGMVSGILACGNCNILVAPTVVRIDGGEGEVIVALDTVGGEQLKSCPFYIPS